MSDNGRVSLLFLANLLLFFTISELNHLASGWGIYLHVDALLVVFFGLYLTRISSLLSAVVLGFLADALHPVPFGSFAAGYLLLWLFFVWCQRRIRRQNRLHIRTVATIGQLIWLTALTLTMGRHMLGEAFFWQRLLLESILSCTTVFVFAAAWCRFQRQFLHVLGWDLEAQMSPL
jgi:cell shape-determining protein MreD